MKKQENEKSNDSESNSKEKFSQNKKNHIKNSEAKIAQLSEEEQEELRAEARERYNRLNGCGG